MGYMRHHAIVVSNCHGEELEKAHKKAIDIFPYVSEITGGTTNGYRSFFIPPDGSKEGCGESDTGDLQRNEFTDYLNSRRYEDDSSPLEWAEIFYGDDEGMARVERHSNELTGGTT